MNIAILAVLGIIGIWCQRQAAVYLVARCPQTPNQSSNRYGWLAIFWSLLVAASFFIIGVFI